MGDHHLAHLRSTLTDYYEITEDLRGNFFVGIDLKWGYIGHICRLSMNWYLRKLLNALGHPPPNKQQLSHHKRIAIQYGVGPQFNNSLDTSPPLYKDGILRVQIIVGESFITADQLIKSCLSHYRI